MALFSAGSILIYHLDRSVLNVITTSRPFIVLLVVFPKALFSALYSSPCTLPLLLPLSFFFLDHHLYADDTQLFSLSTHSTFDSSIFHLQNALQQISSWMTANLLTLNFSKTEFLLIGLKNQLAKMHNSSLDTSHSARNIGFIFDEHLTFSDQITALSKACYYHIRHLHRIRPYLNLSTACTIGTFIIHSKLDYCNSLYYKLLKSQLSHLQQIQNSLARTVVKAPKSCHITPILRSLHWLRITERMEYKLLSLTYKVLTTIALILYYPLLNLTSDPKGTNMNSVGVIWNCIKNPLCPLVFFAICNFCLCFV